MARRKILVVDDSQASRTRVGEFLAADYECIFAINGADGLAKALQLKPDAIVSDLDMPRMDGVGLMRALRASPQTRNIPVIMMTAITDVMRVNECRAFGCAGFVLKPVEQEYLRSKIGLLLRTLPPLAKHSIR